MEWKLHNQYNHSLIISESSNKPMGEIFDAYSVANQKREKRDEQSLTFL